MNEDPHPTSGIAAPAVATAAPTGRYYRPELDVVRLVAFLLVFNYHTLPSTPVSTAVLPGRVAQILFDATRAAGFGLSLFFTLSAFLIAELLLRERQATGQIHTRQFYIRRILRIWPLYFAGLGIGLCIAIFPVIQPGISWTVWAVFLLGNWAGMFIATTSFNPMGVLWSISVEEQFYLFIPWVIKYCTRRTLAYVCVALILVADVWLFFLGQARIKEDYVWYNSFVQFENFAAGILLCLFLHDRIPRPSVPLRLMNLVLAAGCWYTAIAVFHILGYASGGSFSLMAGYALAALGSCLILYAFLGINRKLLPGWAVYLGRISYGLYVFHMLAYQIAGAILPHQEAPGIAARLVKNATALGITILLASLSYHFFESPFLRMKKHFEIVKSRPV
jgi:peptidoglycan/LPS O-acetylase OafA/YrhL